MKKKEKEKRREERVRVNNSVCLKTILIFTYIMMLLHVKQQPIISPLLYFLVYIQLRR